MKFLFIFFCPFFELIVIKFNENASVKYKTSHPKFRKPGIPSQIQKKIQNSKLRIPPEVVVGAGLRGATGENDQSRSWAKLSSNQQDRRHYYYISKSATSLIRELLIWSSTINLGVIVASASSGGTGVVGWCCWSPTWGKPSQAERSWGGKKDENDII